MITKIKTTGKTRALFFFLVDIALLSLSVWFAFLLRFEGAIPAQYTGEFYVVVPTFVGVKVILMYLYGMYHVSWSYISIEGVISLVKSFVISTFVVGSILYLLRYQPFYEGFPRSILVIDLFLSISLVGGFRSAKRIYLQLFRKFPLSGKRTMVVGAGDAGEQIVRSIQNAGGSNGFNPVGFVDDDPQKIGTSIHGVKVLGGRDDIPKLVAENQVEAILIAMPSVSSGVVRETVDVVREAGVKDVKILPDISELMTGQVSLSDARDVKLEDLLGRVSVELDPKRIESFIEGKTVLVTGAAGSIGSELSRQISRFSPDGLHIVDHEETMLFEVKKELNKDFEDLALYDHLLDVRDEQSVRQLFIESRPDLVFHAAAYKHVGMMEEHPVQAVSNNVFGTLSVANAAQEADVDTFVLISTDKAVEPTSTMGATKRIAECIIRHMNSSAESETTFTAVRFGNVLGSRGSVVPIFREQISKGGPVTVTDPKAERYFMITSEAVLLVLQAAQLAKGGEVHVLDMGEPVKILDLAREMIELSGHKPDEDIPITFIGLKEGEKLSEDLLNAEEGTDQTEHPQIFQARGRPLLSEKELKVVLDKLDRLIEEDSGVGVKEYFSELFRNYLYD